MKTRLLLILAPALLAFCADTGFYRTELPVSQRILTNPEWWAKDINPLNAPGATDDYDTPEGRAAIVRRLHRGNIRAITENPGYGLHEDLTEDWKS